MVTVYTDYLARVENARSLKHTITLRRGTATLAPQPALVATYTGQPKTFEGGGDSGAIQVTNEVRGLPEMDIQTGDHFNWGHDETLFVVGFIRPDRSLGTIAEVGNIT